MKSLSHFGFVYLLSLTLITPLYASFEDPNLVEPSSQELTSTKEPASEASSEPSPVPLDETTEFWNDGESIAISEPEPATEESPMPAGEDPAPTAENGETVIAYAGKKPPPKDENSWEFGDITVRDTDGNDKADEFWDGEKWAPLGGLLKIAPLPKQEERDGDGDGYPASVDPDDTNSFIFPDMDHDRIPDDKDANPIDPQDTDLDGTPDIYDVSPLNPKVFEDANLNGIEDWVEGSGIFSDSDGDHDPDFNDPFPDDPTKTSGTENQDTDFDGIPDIYDPYPFDFFDPLLTPPPPLA